MMERNTCGSSCLKVSCGKKPKGNCLCFDYVSGILAVAAVGRHDSSITLSPYFKTNAPAGQPLKLTGTGVAVVELKPQVAQAPIHGLPQDSKLRLVLEAVPHSCNKQ